MFRCRNGMIKRKPVGRGASGKPHFCVAVTSVSPAANICQGAWRLLLFCVWETELETKQESVDTSAFVYAPRAMAVLNSALLLSHKSRSWPTVVWSQTPRGPLETSLQLSQVDTLQTAPSSKRESVRSVRRTHSGTYCMTLNL